MEPMILCMVKALFIKDKSLIFGTYDEFKKLTELPLVLESKTEWGTETALTLICIKCWIKKRCNRGRTNVFWSDEYGDLVVEVNTDFCKSLRIHI